MYTVNSVMFCKDLFLNRGPGLPYAPFEIAYGVEPITVNP